jgi:hypothetical protein
MKPKNSLKSTELQTESNNLQTAKQDTFYHTGILTESEKEQMKLEIKKIHERLDVMMEKDPYFKN